MKIKYSIKDIKKTRKPIDTWWSTLVTDPISVRLVWLVANFTKLTPNQITITSFFLGFISAYFFWHGSYIYLILGALFFQIGFLFDCIDGKLARLTNNKSKFGFFLDFSLDRWRIFLNLLALIYGQYIITQNNIFLILGLVYLFLNMYSIIQTFLEEKLEITTPLMIKNDDNIAGGSLEKKLRNFFNKRRLIFGITDIETDMLIFFVFPLFNLTKLGLIVSIVMMFLWLILVRGIRFMINFKKYNG